MRQKRAYIVTRTNPGYPDLASWRSEELNAYCLKIGYAVVGGANVTGAMTEEFGELICKNAEKLGADVVVTFNGSEFGRDVEEALPIIGRIKRAGIDIETKIGKIPDKLAMFLLYSFGDVIRDMQETEEEVFGGNNGDENQTSVKTLTPEIEYWEADAFKVNEVINELTKDAKTCVIYTRIDPDNFFCDDYTLEEQEKMLQAKAEEKGYVVMEKFRTEDDGYHKDSVGLQMMKRYLASCGVNTVFVTGYDVFSEDAFLCKDIVDDLTHQGISIEPLMESSLRINAREFFQMS